MTEPIPYEAPSIEEIENDGGAINTAPGIAASNTD
jgi:hypothetical protein